MRTLRLISVLIAVGLANIGLTGTAAPATETVYHGSAKSDKYHFPSCEWAQKIAPANLVVFKSKDAAAAKGYVPCKVCRP